jgi:hypothetical protein
VYTHVVLFWLKRDSPPGAGEQLADDCRNLLGRIPDVRHFWVGPPAMTPRDVVDNTFSVGLCVILDDAAGHDAYQTHPLHLEFIARNKPHWQRVVVYDFK